MKLRISLIAKITFATSLILLVFMGILDNINLKNFRKVMVQYAVSNAEEIAEIISQSAFDAMLTNDKTSLYHIIGRIGKSSNIEHIRLIDQKGKVVFSNISGEVGSVVGKHADECIMCHSSANTGISSLKNRSRIITTRRGNEALGHTKAIYNQPACITASCHFHDKNNTVLGLLDISVSLESLRQQSHVYRLQFIILTCVLLLIIGIFVTALIYYLVDVPVQRLVRHSALVASGDLESRVKVSGNDELGELSDSVNQMTESLYKADMEIKSWADSLEQKVEERSLEIMRMEEQLRRSEKLASLGTLAAGVAHEINNPLTGILLFASILNSDKRLHPSLLPDVGRVISETQRCAEIVKELLEFSRESTPVKEEVELESIIDDVAAFFHKQPDFRAVEIIKKFDSSLPKVLIDPNQIRQVFMNLFINAGHSIYESGKLELSTHRSADGKYLSAEIRDNGTGIPEEYLERIFDPFFTTKPEGTGLGLSISYGIIENHGGKITVNSRVSEGTTFTVLLPLPV
ncbi:MAG: ATP-binding protein [Desulfuromonadaceae bacterium]|nr:ATP-binding protein [Desulfuromonadaceae bacterium]MDD2855575.1 ATP-binding protein [Desulfuromonadaceae bacterium]